MGDLLAEALAAFQESHPPLITDDGSPPSENDTDDAAAGSRPAERDAPPPDDYSGLHLAADPVERYPGTATGGITDPVLRLPDLTAEPLWRPPGADRWFTASE
jgi:hypothetical protein